MSTPPLTNGPTEDAAGLSVFPCSSSQRRCWFIDVLRPGVPSLNIALRWEIKGHFTAATIEAAFQRVIARHEILRTRFRERDGEPIQEVLPTLAFRLSEIDFTILPESRRVEEAMELARAEARVPFDLGRLPLIRVTLVRLASHHALLLVTVNQIVFDGRSIHLLADEFGTIAAALEARCEPRLPELPLQYGDYAAWQAAYFESRGFRQEIDYWRGQLAGLPYLEVAPDRPRPAQLTHGGEIVGELLPPELGARMEEAAREHQVSLFSFAGAATAALLHRLTGAQDVVFGTQLDGRDDPDLEGLIGVFLNNLVLRIDASGDPSLRSFIQRTGHVVQEALAHQQVPFDKLVEALNPPRDPSRTPLISVSFTVMHNVLREGHYGDMQIRGQPSLSPGSLYDLNLFIVRWASGWRMAIEYKSDLFTRETAQGILEDWRRTLEAVICRPDAPLSALDVAPRGPPAPERGPALAAVEEVLRGHPLVREAVAVTRAGDQGACFAYVVPSAACDVALEALPRLLLADISRRDLPARLDAISVVLALPRGAGGAVDLPALPPPPTPSSAGQGAEALDAVGETVRVIWQEVLGVPHIAEDDHFFELGGHSLLAVRMVLRVAKQLGQQVEVVSLFQSPTLRAFAAHVSRLKKAAPDWQVVPIQPNGSKTPIIAINNMLAYYDLALMIGPDRPFFSVQMLDATAKPPDDQATFEEMAAQYIQLIRRVRPRGPYILFGLCVHGVLGYEIAQQLRAAGDEIELLVVVNAWHPTYSARLLRRQRWRRKLLHARDSLRQVLAGKKSLPVFLANYSIVRRSGVLQAAVALGLLPAMPPRTGSLTADAWLLYLMDARDRYRPRAYDGPVLHFLPPDAPVGRSYDPTLGWTGTLTGPLALQRIAEPYGVSIENAELTDLGAQIHAALGQAPKAERPLR